MILEEDRDAERKRRTALARYWLGLGSNQGDAKSNLNDAVRRLRAEGIRVVRRSPIYLTEPVGLENQPWFLNQALEATAPLAPAALLRKVKKIERAMGRRPGPRNGPRPIDIDILMGEGVVVATPTLTIPHPRLAERRFALLPLVSIAPNLVHPGLGKKMRALLRSCRDRSKVVRLGTTFSKRKCPGPD